MIQTPDTITRTWQPAAELPAQAEQPRANAWRPAKQKSARYMMPYRPEAVPDTAWARYQAQLSADSARMDESPRQGFVLIKPKEGLEAARRTSGDGVYTWLLLGMGILFVALCLLLRANRHYLQSLRRNLFEVRERNNMFDDTVRETLLTVLLNVLCAGCIGIILYCAVSWMEHRTGNLAAAGACMGISCAYCAVMPLIYWATGRIFHGKRQTSAWLSGFTASQGVLGLCLFPLALLLLFYPEATRQLLIGAGALMLAAKLLVISKGFRIFYRNNGFTLLFLYYLCAVEAVPLLMTFAAALQVFRILT